jgi:hypothetical protein
MAQMPVPAGMTAVGGLDELNSIIASKARDKMKAAQQGCDTFAGALAAVAREEPDLFLTRARLEVDATYRNQTIYFDYVGGQLVNPCVFWGGKMVPIPSPLDTAPINPNLTPEQEMAARVASKMNKVMLSEGRKLPYAEAVRLVASENPHLIRRRERITLHRW